MKTSARTTPVGTRCRASLTLPPAAAPACQQRLEISPPADGEMSGPRTAQPYHALVGTRCRASLTSFPPAVRPFRCLALLALLLLLAPAARAQWQTQTVTLKPAWNAVYLHVDASHDTLDNQVGVVFSNPITEVWLWQPPVSTAQFTTSPQQPSGSSSQWAVWDRSPVVSDTLLRLNGNAAYLVRNTNTTDFVWSITGKPVPPRYRWSTSGLNFVGFPTPTNAAPDFDTFLGPIPEFRRTAEIYRYPGGNLGATNPVRVSPILFRTNLVNRGEAFWIRSGSTYNRYYGPVEVELQNVAGVHFSDNLGTYRIRLKNPTTTARTVALNLLASGTPPAGQTAIAAAPPLLVRGALNTTNLTYAHTVLNTQHSFTLAAQGQPGSELEVVLGLNRSAMTNAPGSLYAGILRFTDTVGLSQQDIPVTALVTDTAGLWVGSASVSQVGNYPKTYAKAANAAQFQAQVDALNAAAGTPGTYTRDTNTGFIIKFEGTNTARYVATSINTNFGSVARPYSLRLIVHSDNTNASLLQRVFYGPRYNPTNFVVATREALLDPASLSSSRRISAAHLPFSHTNLFWPTPGRVQLGTNLVFNVPMDYRDQAANPFLHTFHPDHDNLKSDFRTVQVQGAESYNVTRQITLSFTAPAADFASLTSASTSLGGVYQEVITFAAGPGNSRQFTLGGSFVINRVSPIPILTTE